MKKVVAVSTMVTLITGSALAEVSNEVETAIDPAQEEKRNLAKELANPIASLYTLPIQMNFDRGLGLDGDGKFYQMNFQPLRPRKYFSVKVASDFC